MALLKYLLYCILYLLIKIGDVVAATLDKIFLPIKNVPVFLSAIKNKLNQKSLPKKISKKEKNNSSIKVTISQQINTLGSFSRKIRTFTTLILARLLQFIVAPFSFLLHFVISQQISLHFPTRKKVKKTHAHKAKKQTIYRGRYLLIGGILSFFIFFIPSIFFIYISDLPSIDGLSVNYIPKTTKILDRNGNLLYEFYANQNRTTVTINKVPKQLREATIAIEDKDFYNHPGIDIRGIMRAAFVDLKKDDLQGGSTITQQLIKSALLTPEPKISRKLKEIVLALWAEKKYTKDQILELYFNYVPYGGTAWGVESASEIYFGKDVSNLDLAQSSYLAGLPRAPSIYSPFMSDGTLGKKRQKEVLRAMVRDKYITQAQADSAFAEKLEFISSKTPIHAPHFVMYVKELLVQKYGLFAVERGGLSVVTSLDLAKQEAAENIVADEVEKNQYLGIGNGAALITNPQNGDILAMVGSHNYFDTAHDGNVNLTLAPRQPGSTIKVVTYALALSSGYTEASILDDTPLTITYPGGPSYSPVNYDGRFHGRIPLRTAFANSFNIPAVRLAQKFGVDKIVSLGQDMGISTWKVPNNYGVSITLGGAETTMSDLVTAYGTVANSGKRESLNPILEVRDFKGNLLESKKPEEKQVLSEGVAFIISDILSDNVARSMEFGSNSPLVVSGKRVSVKTGTTDNKKDNWTIGYTKDLLVATWVGNNDGTPLNPALASGITGAAPIWNRIMTSLLADKDTGPVVLPASVIKQSCFGRDAYFLVGTNAANPCAQRIIPTPTFQQQ